MAKTTKRTRIKGTLDMVERVMIVHDKDLGEIHYRIEDLLLPYNDLDDVTLTLSHDKELVGEEMM